MCEAVAALVWCPFPDGNTARGAATQLLSERLIACANILPGAESVFEWNDVVSTACEVVAVFKTTGEHLDTVTARLGLLHPYDTPAIVGWECGTAHPETLEWLSAALGQTTLGTD